MTNRANKRPIIDLGGDWTYREDRHWLGEKYSEELAYTHAGEARWMDEKSMRRNWLPCTVPGFWPEGTTSADHPVWFRKRFDVPVWNGRSVLNFEGVNYFCDIWLNGRFVGSHEGYLGSLRFDVTGLLEATNELVVKVVPANDVLGEDDQMAQFKRHFVGALGRWDMNDPERKPAGIWGNVWLDQHGPVGIEKGALKYAIQTLPSGFSDSAVDVLSTLEVSLAAIGSFTGSVQVEWSIAPNGFEGIPVSGSLSVQQVVGKRSVSVDIHHSARLWWTWDLGTPRLYDVSVTVKSGKELFDTMRWTTGFRHLGLGEGWDLKLNGVSLYQRGANYLSELDMARMSYERYRKDVDLIVGANLNTIHPFCHVERDAFYEACDRRGVLVYQDFPLWLMADTSSGFAREAVRQFVEMQERLDGRPSVAIWNFGSQASVANMDKLCLALLDHARHTDPQRIAHMSNAAVAYEEHDYTHPTKSFFWTRGEAEWFAKKYAWRPDTHMYPGWYFGEVGTIAGLPLQDFGLVTEFGAQALPNAGNLSTFMQATGEIDWDAIALRCGQPWLLRRHNPDATTVEELIESSQRYQARLLRFNTEFIRGRKGRPGRGLHVFAFNDCWPSITWSIIDYDREPKAAYHALAQSMAPVQAFLTDFHRLETLPDSLDFSVVNDGSGSLGDVVLKVTVDTAEGSLEFEQRVGEVGTDAAVSLSVPVSAGTGRAARSIRAEVFSAGHRISENHYSL